MANMTEEKGKWSRNRGWGEGSPEQISWDGPGREL